MKKDINDYKDIKWENKRKKKKKNHQIKEIGVILRIFLV